MADKIELRLDSSGKLIDPPTEKLDGIWDKKVTWKIKHDEIKSFRIETKAGCDFYPFTRQPNPNQGTTEKLEVPWWPEKGVWEYNIIWTDHAGNLHCHDPKIAVNPFGRDSLLFRLLIIIVGSIFGFLFYRKKKKN